MVRKIALAALTGVLVSGTAYAADDLRLDSGMVSGISGEVQPFKLVDGEPAKADTHHTWEMPPVTVVGQKSELREEDRIGTYQQPRWTADRRFPITRTYVIPENKVEFEYWMRADIPRKGSTHLEQMQELEFGLPYRLQLDLYFVENTEGTKGDITLDQSIEFRWAFADWGKLFLNPAVYAEYTHTEEGPDKVEFKLLLTEEIAPKWHAGANLVWEHETGGEFENTYEGTFGVSYTVIDEKFSVGGEIKAALNDVHEDRGHYVHEFYVGPSIQWRPIERMHIDLAPIVGLTGGSDAMQVFLIIGYEF